MTHRLDSNRYYHSGVVDLGVMIMKGYSTLPWFPELEPHHQIQFCVIPLIPPHFFLFFFSFFCGSYHSAGNTVDIFYDLAQYWWVPVNPHRCSSVHTQVPKEGVYLQYSDYMHIQVLQFYFLSLYCNHTLKECTGLPRQWCSWALYKFSIFRHNTCSPKWPYQNYYSGRRSCSTKVCQVCKTTQHTPEKVKMLLLLSFKLEVANKKWHTSLHSQSRRVKKVNNHLLIFSWILYEFTHMHWARSRSR